MKPYYEDGSVTIYHGDCRDVLPHIEAAVMVTDPPYGMKYRSGWSGAEVAGDGDTSVRDEVLAMWAPRAVAVFGRWNIPRPRGVIARLVWDKGDWPGMGNLSFPWGPSDEEVYILGDGWERTPEEWERQGTILRRRRIGGNGVHPTEKPVDLLENLIRPAPLGTVVDPFMGSGPTLAAAKNLGRRAIGMETWERYCEIAAARCSQEVLAL